MFISFSDVKPVVDYSSSNSEETFHQQKPTENIIKKLGTLGQAKFVKDSIESELMAIET